jgi:alpha-tubulin suppressor-like RCC1 family protein
MLPFQSVDTVPSMTASPAPSPLHRSRARVICALAAIAVAVLACKDNPTDIPAGVQLSVVDIDQNPTALERGTRDTLSATTVDTEGDTIEVPVVWHSSNERVARFERGGVLVALDTGVTIITASSLGITSQGVEFGVVWVGPASIDTLTWTRPHALMPGAALTDSVRVRVLNIDSLPVANALVRFMATAGDGAASPVIDTTDALGVATARWTLGPSTGLNVLTASVVRSDSTLDPQVADNTADFSITAYNALAVEAGDGQTGEILSDLPVQPAVRLVDSLGNARPGVPVTFTASAGGRVTTATVSTNANGVASPGTWTLGDIPGEQFLEARVSDATIRLFATATGTPIHYTPAFVAAGGFVTCARESDDSVKCWGEGTQNGTGVPADTARPTTISGSFAAASLHKGSTHTCALTAAGEAWCWGAFAMMDTSGATTDAGTPTEMPTDLTFSQIAPGFRHNCAIATSQIAYCWGQNPSGQLGDGTIVSHFVPAPVSGGFTFSQIASGTSHSCALSIAGTAFCWGSNQTGQLGDATTQQRTSPTAVAGGHTFQSIGAGETFSCGLRTDGRVYCWGTIGGSPVQSTPFTYPSAPIFTALSVGAQHACALTADGTAYCWGINGGDGQGRLGDGTTVNRAAPTPVAGDLRFSQISAGFRHTCALTVSEGAVACWGQNGSLELGDNRAAFHLTPRYVVLGVTP